MNERMDALIDVWMDEWMDEWMNQWRDEHTNIWISEGKMDRVNALINVWMDQWRDDELMYAWRNESMNYSITKWI